MFLTRAARRQEVEWVGGFVLILVSEDLGYLGSKSTRGRVRGAESGGLGLKQRIRIGTEIMKGSCFLNMQL